MQGLKRRSASLPAGPHLNSPGELGLPSWIFALPLGLVRWILVFSSIFALSCSADSVETVFDPCSPQVITPGQDSRESELQSIEDALSLWSQVLPVQLTVGEPSDSAAGLTIHFDSGDTFYRALYLDKSGEILIGRDKLAPEDLPLALAHELGHAFGLLHVAQAERPSVMNVGNLDVDPTAEDARSVDALWETCADAANLDR